MLSNKDTTQIDICDIYFKDDSQNLIFPSSTYQESLPLIPSKSLLIGNQVSFQNFCNTENVFLYNNLPENGSQFWHYQNINFKDQECIKSIVMKAKCKNAQRNKFIAKMINENRELGICSPFEYFGVRYEGCGKIGPYNPVGSRHYHKLKVVDSDGKRVWVRCGKYLKNDNLINNLLVKDEISKV